jgi:hypothetical protein
MVRHTGENFIDLKCIAVASVFTLQSYDMYSAELDAPDGVSLHG